MGRMQTSSRKNPQKRHLEIDILDQSSQKKAVHLEKKAQDV